MDTYPKVRVAQAMEGWRLRVTFSDGSIKVYDCTPLLQCAPFRRLADEAFFRAARADSHGYGVVWSADVDLAESELWLGGVPEAAHESTPA